MGRYSHLITRGQESPLSSIPFHGDTKAIRRIVWPGFPLHIAVHLIERVSDMPERYVLPHCHDYQELNIITSPTELVYEITLGEERYTAKAPCAVWIPEGVAHAANVVSGTGTFFCVILGDRYVSRDAQGDKA